MFKYLKNHRRGIFGTILFHISLIAFFILYKGFTTPLPLPEEEGILVNFGTDNTGLGEIEPPKKEVFIPEEPVSQPVTEEEAKVENTEEEILTQETEDAPEVNAALQKKKEEKEKQERIKKAEIERKRLEEIEKQKQAEIEQKKREEQKRILEERMKQQFAKGNESNSTGSEGKTKGTGNQGKIDGAPNADNYVGNSKGENGVSFSLQGRNPLTLPKPDYVKQEQGIIVVEVIVDRDGNVVDAIPGKKGTTITDNKLMQAAKKAALNAKFDTKPDAPPRQTGSITYHFLLE
ncbi:MAG: cell envelope integrity protein TolA [Chlorobi bacterium]|nr:cell envelope integrity protein TolA [Chlorobiota bacterium]